MDTPTLLRCPRCGTPVTEVFERCGVPISATEEMAVHKVMTLMGCCPACTEPG